MAHGFNNKTNTHELLTISTDQRFAASLKYIMRRLDIFKKNKAVCVRTVTKCGRSELVITLNLDAADVAATVSKLGLAVVDCIADVVITDCKSYYIENSLKLLIDDEISHYAFIKALSNFDNETDKIIAKSLIKLTPVFLLDSFYQFMIDDLKVRWNEVCMLANENASYLVCAGTFQELLRFLISNLQSREREVHLFENSGVLEILSSGLKPIKNIYVNEDLPADVQIVGKLISVAPKKIYLHQNKDSSITPLITLIQNLFGSCVHVVQN